MYVQMKIKLQLHFVESLIVQMPYCTNNNELVHYKYHVACIFNTL